MSLTIRKVGNKNFTHTWTGFELTPYTSSDIVLTGIGSRVYLRSEDGRIIGERFGWVVTTISLIDETGSGTVETFSSVNQLTNRLIALGYPAYYEDGEVQWGSVGGDINNQTDLITLINTINGTSPVENEYANVAAMLADQVNQTTTYFQYVIDTEEYYEKLSTSNASIDDYRLLSDTETVTITDSNGYRVFRIQAIQDDATPTSVAAGGRISFNYDTGTDKVTSIVFNQIYSTAITRFYEERASNDYVVKFYNRFTSSYLFARITGWTLTSGRYIVDVDDTIDISEINIGDRVELFFDINKLIDGGTA